MNVYERISSAADVFEKSKEENLASQKVSEKLMDGREAFKKLSFTTCAGTVIKEKLDARESGSVNKFWDNKMWDNKIWDNKMWGNQNVDQRNVNQQKKHGSINCVSTKKYGSIKCESAL